MAFDGHAANTLVETIEIEWRTLPKNIDKQSLL